MGKWLLSAISVVITSQVVCPPGGGEGSVQADEAGHVPDPGIQHRQHTLAIVAHPSPEKAIPRLLGPLFPQKPLSERTPTESESDVGQFKTTQN